MTDRDMTISAAKAMGLELDLLLRPDGLPFYHTDRGAVALSDGAWFGPLQDDGDALRLAVARNIDVSFYRAFPGCHEAFSRATWYTDDETFGECDELHGSDKNAATRRAIVRAAAATVEGEKE